MTVEDPNDLAGYRTARNIVRLLGNDDDQLQLEALASLEKGIEQEATWRALANLEGLSDDTDIQQLLSCARRPAVKPSHRSRYKLIGAVAAVMVVACAAVIIALQPITTSQSDFQRYVTRTGELKPIELGDGSRVTLNTGTEILAEISTDERRVILSRGEAHFEVARDESKRFYVELGDQAVSVLGTAFNLHRSAEGFVLTVTEGEVAVHALRETVMRDATLISQSETLVLYPGNQRRVPAGWQVNYVSSSQTLSATMVDVNHAVDWRDGVLNFVDTPLVQVVKELNRYSAKKILIEDASIMKKPVTATIRIDSISAALNGLSMAQSLKITHDFDYIVITNKK